MKNGKVAKNGRKVKAIALLFCCVGNCVVFIVLGLIIN
jgi:hypothetical protein